MADAAHWDRIYSSRDESEVSWFEAEPLLSLEFIEGRATPSDPVIDVGGGASRFVDRLAARGFSDLTVLDHSEAALARTRARLGPAAGDVRFIQGDVTAWRPDRSWRIWHDRAVFHFLIEDDARRAYVEAMSAALASGGWAILMTFADDGPVSCSGLPIRRYAPEDLAAEIERLAPGLFTPVLARRWTHRTPLGREQRFQASLFRRN